MANWSRDNYRNSGMDVLEYFRMHEFQLTIVCGGIIRRARLAKVNGGLYRSLFRAGKLEEAVPEKLHEVGHNGGGLPLSNDRVRRIVDSHKTYDGNALRAGRDLGHNTSTIISHWRAAGKEIKPCGGVPLPSEEIDKIIKAHKIYDGNAYRAERDLGYDSSTIISHWRAAGLAIRPKGRPR